MRRVGEEESGPPAAKICQSKVIPPVMRSKIAFRPNAPLAVCSDVPKGAMGV